ncbi:hypothetical protein T484DRAFT_1876782, partial [Baffinella frigidus]
ACADACGARGVGGAAGAGGVGRGEVGAAGGVGERGVSVCVGVACSVVGDVPGAARRPAEHDPRTRAARPGWGHSGGHGGGVRPVPALGGRLGVRAASGAGRQRGGAVAAGPAGAHAHAERYAGVERRARRRRRGEARAAGLGQLLRILTPVVTVGLQPGVVLEPGGRAAAVGGGVGVAVRVNGGASNWGDRPPLAGWHSPRFQRLSRGGGALRLIKELLHLRRVSPSPRRPLPRWRLHSRRHFHSPRRRHAPVRRLCAGWCPLGSSSSQPRQTPELVL